jgi:putative chitinase
MNANQFAQALNCKIAVAEYWLPYHKAAMEERGINTYLQTAMYLAQIGHESQGLKYTEEVWGPTPAQLRYEGRVDLGNTQSGDGFNCRGFGPIQITGRYNLTKLGEALGADFINNPEARKDPSLIARSAAWYWQTHGLNKWADAQDIDGASDVINRGKPTPAYGDSNGFADRKKRYEVALVALSDASFEPIKPAAPVQQPTIGFLGLILKILQAIFAKK